MSIDLCEITIYDYFPLHNLFPLLIGGFFKKIHVTEAEYTRALGGGMDQSSFLCALAAAPLKPSNARKRSVSVGCEW